MRRRMALTPVMPLLFRPVEYSFCPREMIAQQHQSKDDEWDAGAWNERKREDDSYDQEDRTSEYSDALASGSDHQGLCLRGQHNPHADLFNSLHDPPLKLAQGGYRPLIYGGGISRQGPQNVNFTLVSATRNDDMHRREACCTGIGSERLSSFGRR